MHTCNVSTPVIALPFRKLRCCYTNALTNKIDELRSRIKLSSPDIICISEAFPNNCLFSVLMVEFHIEDCDYFCSDFQHHNRGVCIYVRSILSAQKLNRFNNSQFKECIFCSLSLLYSVNMNIGIVYRSPNNSESSDSNLCNLFKEVSDNAFSKSHLRITGDFNFPNINWNSWSAPNWDSGASLFLEALDDSFLFQHVSIPIRLSEGQISSTLDLIITNEDNVIENLIASDPLGESDHVVMEYEYILLMFLNQGIVGIYMRVVTTTTSMRSF